MDFFPSLHYHQWQQSGNHVVSETAMITVKVESGYPYLLLSGKGQGERSLHWSMVISSHQKAQATAVHVIYTESRGSPHAQ